MHGRSHIKYEKRASGSNTFIKKKLSLLESMSRMPSACVGGQQGKKNM